MDPAFPPAASGTATGPGAPDRIRYDRRGVLWNGETVRPARVLPAPAVSGSGRAGHRSKGGAGMDYEAIAFETEGEVGILTYNRPKMVNAINRKMLEELYDFWQARQRDFATRVIIVTGSGEKGFCSGLDMKSAMEFAPEGGPTGASIWEGQIHFSGIIRLMRSCPQPIIAAVHGPAMGAGLSFALAADVRLASEDAFFCAQ